jgi:hypothetical protein
MAKDIANPHTSTVLEIEPPNPLLNQSSSIAFAVDFIWVSIFVRARRNNRDKDSIKTRKSRDSLPKAVNFCSTSILGQETTAFKGLNELHILSR